MRTCLLPLLAFVTCNAWAQSGCRTALDVPCYTIQANRTQWQVFMNGSHEITKWVSTSVDALRSHGSQANIGDSSAWHLTSPNLHFKGSRFYLAPQNQIVMVDETKQTIMRRDPLYWHDLPYRRSTAHDGTCASGIRHSGTDFTKQETTKIAGVDVVRWYRPLGNGGYEEQYLAPSMDCLSLKSYSIHKSTLHLPTFITSSEATQVQFGDPAPALFNLPKGYRPLQVSAPRKVAPAHGRESKVLLPY